jgi:hypothetical protein
VPRPSLLLPPLVALAAWGLTSAGAKVAPPDEKDSNPDSKEMKRKPPFTIGKETTRVTGPLNKDGSIDYVAALNERLRRGVTPANNAVVLLWQATGPHPERATMPPKFFRWLQAPAPPERGDYYIGLFPYAKKHLQLDSDSKAQKLYAHLDRCPKRPWTALECPDVAAWLKAIEKPLALVVKASKRSRYYSPLTPRGKAGLMGALLPGVQPCRECAAALAARAMLHTGAGRTDDAWQDLLACHRLGRLVASGGTLIEALVGVSIEVIACNADLAFLTRSQLTKKQVLGCLADLWKLPLLPSPADKVDLLERFTFLESVTMLATRQDANAILRFLEAEGAPKLTGPKLKKALRNIDWDLALRTGNQWYDQVVGALADRDRASRRVKLEQFEQKLKTLKKTLSDGGEKGLVKRLEKNPGKTLGEVLVVLLLPAVRRVQTAVERGEQVQENVRAAFALAAYHRGHGRFPKELGGLVPKYLAKGPLDLFSGKPLVYRPVEKGYLLYSVGPNGKDEGGRDPTDVPPGDDLSVRMPLPPLPKEHQP